MVNDLKNVSSLNIFLTLLWPQIFHQNCQAAFGCCEHQWVNDLFFPIVK